MSRVIVIGGGAAGMMAAYTAAANGNAVTLLEKNEKLGKKIYITGKGRCNFTNACDFETFQNNIVTNPKFMFSSLKAFTPQDMIDFLENAGCATKVERGNRAFPLSDHASDVTAAIHRKMKEVGVKVELNTEVLDISKVEPEGDAEAAFTAPRFQLSCKSLKDGKRRVYGADSVIVATGGLSYPSTGSTGDGYQFAESFGLKNNPCNAALVPLNTAEKDYEELQGVSLKNVSVRMWADERKKPIMDTEPGELLFTHFGLSGPLILSASSIAAGYMQKGSSLRLEMDLKPALTEEMLDARILRDFEEARNMNISNALGKLLISSLRPVVLRRAGIDPEKKVRDITREERVKLVEVVKHMDYHITGTRGYNEAIVTHGGIAVSEINPKTMECKKVPGLYFVGEVLDVDAFTGGFNLQIAWSTGVAAGNAV